MKRILLISQHVPTKGHAGGLRLLDLYCELRKIEPELYLALVSVRSAEGVVDEAGLSDLFNEVHLLDQAQFNNSVLSALAFDVSEFDLIDLAYHQSGALIPACRKRWPMARVLFSPMEAQSRSLVIWLSGEASRVIRSWRMTAGLLRNSVVEIFYMWRADKVVAVSDADSAILALFRGKSRVVSMPTCLSSSEFPSSRSQPVAHDQLCIVFLHISDL